MHNHAALSSLAASRDPWLCHWVGKVASGLERAVF